MVKVKAQKNFYGTGHGSVRKGDVIEVSEASARAMRENGLVTDASDTDVSTASTKAAVPPKNKMDPAPKNKGASEEEYEPGIVRSTANDLGAGGAQPDRAPTRRK
jgi:hypothetical protein